MYSKIIVKVPLEASISLLLLPFSMGRSSGIFVDLLLNMPLLPFSFGRGVSSDDLDFAFLGFFVVCGLLSIPPYNCKQKYLII